jgi:hypothetical protein
MMKRHSPKRERKKSTLDNLRLSDMHSVDHHPAVHAVPSPRHFSLSSPKVINTPTSPAGAPLRHNRAVAGDLTASNVARHAGHHAGGRASKVSGMVSPFTPRTPSRLRISANTPLRASLLSRGSNGSTSPLSSGSPTSTSPLSRAGVSSFDSPDHILGKLGTTTRTLDFTTRISPTTSPKSISVIGSPGSRKSYTSSNQSNMSPSDPFLSSELANRHYDHISPSKRPSQPNSSSPRLLPPQPKLKPQPQPQPHPQPQQPQPQPHPQPRPNIHHNIDILSSNRSMVPRQIPHTSTKMVEAATTMAKTTSKTKTKTKTTIAMPNSPVMDWNKPIPKLTAEERRIEWQFDEDGKPKVYSSSFMDRSQYMVQLFDRYDRKCTTFLKEQALVLEIASLGSARVDQRKAQMVAANMVDKEVKYKKHIEAIQEDIQNNHRELKRMEDERASLENVLRDQQRLIHQLTYS